MQVQDQSLSSYEVTYDSILESIDKSVGDTSATLTPSFTTKRIPRVPATVRAKPDYEEYYVPKFVTLGPYHSKNPKIQLGERKRVIANRLFSNNKEALRNLLHRLGEPEMVKDLKSFYEEESTKKFCDMVFTEMMLLDGCFIVYFIRFHCGLIPEHYSELRSNEIFCVRRDLYLLENQIPFKVLKEVMTVLGMDSLEYISPFIDFSSFVIRRRPERKCLDNLKAIGSNEGDKDVKEPEPDHLLGALHSKHSRIVKSPRRNCGPFKLGHNFRNVNELVDVGINFKPIKDTLSLAHIEYIKGWWGFSANVKLPPIAVSRHTRPMLLNLIAYESCFPLFNSWVTWYVCLLDNLIDHPEDVKVLRKAWVLDNLLASDQEVVKLFDEIGTDLVQNSSAYLEAMYKIQRHYESRRNRLFSQLKNEYFKSPWAFVALLGALVALFLTGAQTYYTVWSPKSTCDDLCMFLKMNHHL